MYSSATAHLVRVHQDELIEQAGHLRRLGARRTALLAAAVHRARTMVGSTVAATQAAGTPQAVALASPSPTPAGPRHRGAGRRVCDARKNVEVPLGSSAYAMYRLRPSRLSRRCNSTI